MYILKYSPSRSYRNRFDSEYTKELCDKLATEQKQKQNIYEGIGLQFISNRFQDAYAEYNIAHGRIPFKSPNMNAHTEACHSILESECLSIYEFG